MLPLWLWVPGECEDISIVWTLTPFGGHPMAEPVDHSNSPCLAGSSFPLPVVSCCPHMITGGSLGNYLSTDGVNDLYGSICLTVRDIDPKGLWGKTGGMLSFICHFMVAAFWGHPRNWGKGQRPSPCASNQRPHRTIPSAGLLAHTHSWLVCHVEIASSSYCATVS